MHSIGFAPREAIAGNFLDGLTRENFRIAHDISAYSFPAMAKAALPYLSNTASLLTLYPYSRIVIYRDFDKAGINAANAAVALDPSRVSVVEPPADAPAWATDWNDYLVFEREKDID